MRPDCAKLSYMCITMCYTRSIRWAVIASTEAPELVGIQDRVLDKHQKWLQNHLSNQNFALGVRFKLSK